MLRPLNNPPNRFDPRVLDWEEPPELARLEVYEDASRSILAKNDSPDLSHRYSLNPYRGCQHACAYCYARSSHEYLGFGAGTDHDTRILVKPDAAALLVQAFEAPDWQGDTVLFSGNTDCYQPLEHRWRLTRACLEVCLRYRNPVTVITKSALIVRDTDLLAALAVEARVRVVLSIPFHDARMGRLIEPGAPSPERRYAAIRRLVAAGVPVSVNVAPILPGLNDTDIPAVLQQARAAGATRAAMILVRLVGSVAPVFEARLREALPDRADTVLARIRRMRGGRLGSTRFGERMAGAGPEWEVIEALFRLWVERLGYARPGAGEEVPAATTFRRPPRAGDQLRLFG